MWQSLDYYLFVKTCKKRLFYGYWKIQNKVQINAFLPLTQFKIFDVDLKYSRGIWRIFKISFDIIRVHRNRLECFIFDDVIVMVLTKIVIRMWNDIFKNGLNIKAKEKLHIKRKASSCENVILQLTILIFHIDLKAKNHI